MKLFSFFSKKNEQLSRQKLLEIEKRIIKLEKDIKEDLKTLLEKMEHTKKANEGDPPPPAIKIDHLQVDHITIEKLDYANNFGQLGIKELTGKLNIGTSYEGDISKKLEKKLEEKLGKQPKVNLRGKGNSS